ncbi:MinD/ParA family protein [Desulfocurvus vexinensis]|uniref:MinD/ParA family protein n=1 Tax=Desulfocurvus vexinensis TaxID=399548 RepID=UPI0004BC3C4B|nr:MinD/ParA family protein [Desulfocurvus vexinensis]
MRIVPLAPGQPPTRVICVASGKGGVGKTSLATGLAFALAARGNRVCLLDADLGLANVDIVLGVSPDKTLEDVLFGGVPMAEAIVPVAPGVDLVSGASGVPRLAELTRAERMRLAAQFAALDGYDYLIVDNSPGISAQVVSLCLSARDLVVVATPDATAITDAYALIKVLTRSGLWWSPFICVNRARGRQQGRLVFEKLRATAGKHLGLNCRYLGCVLEDEAVGLAASLRKPVAEAAPRSGAARDLAALAQTLDEADTPGRRRDVSPQRFLDGSVMRLKQERGALAGIARTTERFQRELATAAPARQDQERLQEGLARLGRGLDRLERLHGPAGQADRARLMAAMRAELAALRAVLAPGQAPAAGPGRAPAPVPPLPPRRPGSLDLPPAPSAQGDETLPGMRAALAALAEASAPAAPAAGAPGGPRQDRALLVCPPSPMREVLAEVLAGAGLRPEAVHPRALNGGDHFAGYRLGLVCWDAPARDLERVVARAGSTPVLMLRGFRHTPGHEPDLTGLPVTVLHKPFQVQDLYGAIRRATGTGA